MTATPQHRLRPLHVAVFVAWLALIFAGSAALWRYKQTPGAPGAPPSEWPAGAALSRAPGAPTLVMFAHPMCVCTRASFDELEIVMERARGRVRAYVVFVSPEGEVDGFDSDAYWNAALGITGVTPVRDRGGALAARFAASTSGHVLLYGADGRLLYSGGITGARGHAGDNEGRRALVALIEGAAPASARQPVYGCGLDDPRPTGPREGQALR
jgi:hypothetical protein